MNSEPTVDAERLAALIDGRLTADERRVVLEQVAASEELSSLYADAIAARAATAPSSRWPRWSTRQLALAATVLIAIVGTLWYRAASRTDADRIVAHAAPLSGRGLPDGWERRPWSDVRGDVVVSDLGRAARFGALSVDLEVALSTRDTSAARVAREISALLSALPASSPVIALYEDLASRFAAGGFDAELMARARRAALAMLDPDIVEVAAWAEAGLLTVARGDSSYFASARVVRLLESLTTRADLPRPAMDAMARLISARRTSARLHVGTVVIQDLRLLLQSLAA